MYIFNFTSFPPAALRLSTLLYGRVVREGSENGKNLVLCPSESQLSLYLWKTHFFQSLTPSDFQMGRETLQFWWGHCALVLVFRTFLQRCFATLVLYVPRMVANMHLYQHFGGYLHLSFCVWDEQVGLFHLLTSCYSAYTSFYQVSIQAQLSQMWIDKTCFIYLVIQIMLQQVLCWLIEIKMVVIAQGSSGSSAESLLLDHF